VQVEPKPYGCRGPLRLCLCCFMVFHRFDHVAHSLDAHLPCYQPIGAKSLSSIGFPLTLTDFLFVSMHADYAYSPLKRSLDRLSIFRCFQSTRSLLQCTQIPCSAHRSMIFAAPRFPLFLPIYFLLQCTRIWRTAHWSKVFVVHRFSAALTDFLFASMHAVKACSSTCNLHIAY